MEIEHKSRLIKNKVNKTLFNISIFSKFSKLSSLLFKIIFINPRTYIFAFLLPLLISILFSWLWNNYSYYQVLPPILLNFIAVSVFFTSFYLGIFIIEWRKTNFLKRIKIIGINEYYIILVMFLLNLSLVAISIIINIICYNLYSLIPIFNFNLQLLSNIHWFIWFFYSMGMILLTFFLTVLSIFLTTAFPKRNLSFIILAITILFLLTFSDVLIEPMIINGNWLFIILGYLCPTKYFIWFNMLIVSYQFLDSLGISQIIQNYNQQSFIVFNNIWQTIIPMIGLILIFTYVAKRFFNWGVKG